MHWEQMQRQWHQLPHHDLTEEPRCPSVWSIAAMGLTTSKRFDRFARQCPGRHEAFGARDRACPSRRDSAGWPWGRR